MTLHPPTIHTRTPAPGDLPPSPSLFIQSLISFHQVCLVPFSHLHFSTLLDTLVGVKSNPSFLPGLYLSLFAPRRIFVFFPLSSPLPPFSSSYFLSLSPFCLPPFLNILLRVLKSSPRSFSVLYSPLSLLHLLSSSSSLLSSATSHPLFSPPRLSLSLSPFLFSQPLFSFTLGVGALWRLSAPSGASSGEKELKSKLWDRGGKVRNKKKGWVEEVYVKEIDQMPVWTRWLEEAPAGFSRTPTSSLLRMMMILLI